MAGIVTEKQRKNREYYLAHQDEIKARVSQYRLDNPEKVSAAKKRCYENKKPKYAAHQKAYYEAHFETHREKRNARGRAWREANPEKNAAKNKAWKQANHDKVMESWRKRRAIQLGIEGGHFTDKEFLELCDFYGNKCLKCGVTGKLTADHVIPLNLQVPHSDEISNIQPLCLSCNSKKHTKTVDYRSTFIRARGAVKAAPITRKE